MLQLDRVSTSQGRDQSLGLKLALNVKFMQDRTLQIGAYRSYYFKLLKEIEIDSHAHGALLRSECLCKNCWCIVINFFFKTNKYKYFTQKWCMDPLGWLPFSCTTFVFNIGRYCTSSILYCIHCLAAYVNWFVQTHFEVEFLVILQFSTSSNFRSCLRYFSQWQCHSQFLQLYIMLLSFIMETNKTHCNVVLNSSKGLNSKIFRKRKKRT